jgi:hypothetical protein
MTKGASSPFLNGDMKTKTEYPLLGKGGFGTIKSITD